LSEADPTTVLVVTPSMGGHYFGELLAGLAREVGAEGGRVVVVETLPESAPQDEAGEPGDFAIPVAWSLVDGVVSVTTAVGAPYLRGLRDAGRPVILSSTLMADFDAPGAMPDNHGGAVTAVEHLLRHGHTSVGFVGNFAQQDIRDRFAGYEHAMRSHGLTPDPRYVVTAPDNGEAGGRDAARALLARTDRPTAVLVATDRNALGLMSVLTEAGVRLPVEMAVVGFDNIEAGALAVPALTSVDQPFDEVGSLAGRLVLAAARGEQVPSTPVTPRSPSLMLRASCGCSREDAMTSPGRPLPSADLLRERLQQALVTTLVTDGVGEATAHEAVPATIGAVDRLVGSGRSLTQAQVDAAMARLRRMTSRASTVRRITEAFTAYTEGLLALGVHAEASARVTAALWRLQAGAFRSQVDDTETAIAEQYVVDAGLLDTTTNDPRELAWLAGTHVRAGILALWAEAPSDGLLDIVGTYDPIDALATRVGARTDVRSFPPPALLDLVRAAGREICVVVPVRTATHDWGLLAIVGAVDSRSTRETYQHWAGLLSTALESQRLEEEVRRAALYDTVTGLANRRLFLDRLTEAIARRDRSGTPFAVLFLDLDGFKLVNDSLGHQTGDHLLAVVGNRIRRELRSVDTGARFGGDEFALLLHDTGPEGALLAARRLQEALAEGVTVDGADLPVRASIGIVTSTADESSAEELLRAADIAMYRAKSDDPGTAAFFDDAMRADTLRLRRLHADVARALDLHQFEVHYQPIVDLTSGHTDRFEALVRWRHPQRGLVMPGEFLPVMDETGLSVRLGYWILDEVCRQLGLWGPRVASVAVNLSERQFWHAELLPRLLETLDRHHLTPDRLTLEVKEAVLVHRRESALQLMQQLHDAGLRLHLDNFGTEYSSLETLQRFPVDAFKIDRSFLSAAADEGSERRRSALLTSLVGLGTSLGLTVVAEGVETSAQLSLLQRLGCAAGQGYLFTPAVSQEQAPSLLDRDLAHQPGATDTWAARRDAR